MPALVVDAVVEPKALAVPGRFVVALPTLTRRNGPPPIWLGFGSSGRDTIAEAAWKKPEVRAVMALETPLAVPLIGPLLKTVCSDTLPPGPFCTRKLLRRPVESC